MTTDQMVLKVGEQAKKIKVLRDDNKRIWQSREEWKRKHAVVARENTALRREVARLRKSRAMWRSRHRPSPKTYRPSIQLLDGDLKRILGIPARD